MTQTRIDSIKSTELEEGDQHLAHNESAAATVEPKITLALPEYILCALEWITECLSVADTAIHLRASFESVKWIEDTSEEQACAH